MPRSEAMCNDNDMGEYLHRSDDLTRRQFGALSLGTGLVMLLPRAVNALDVTEMDIDIPTPDGTADCYFAYPSSGAHPGVLLWPDAGSLRPAYKQMGKRLAESGYSVLVVNPYYRNRRAPVMPAPEGVSLRDFVRPFQDALNAETAVTDAVAFVRFLDSQAAVDKNRGIGTVGYCMGGPFTMRTAAALPDRIGAGASFHGARLVTDQPDSPHLLIPKMKGRYLFAIGKDDDEREPEAKNVLRTAFAAAGLPAEIEVYDAPHGWCTPDLGVYDEAEAERAWKRLLVLFEAALA
jgi:carboxymethylenebutenolidase